ncbi:MAG: hypothetical protein RBR97_18865 [Bacteroidales bacterium]|nr:hypothetical protein [Bacteroidales bacterium]
MQPSGKLIINLRGNDKSFVLWNGTESYYKKLRSAYKEVSKENYSEHLYFGFFTLCSATLEYSLNFILADFAVKKFGPYKYKDYCDGYINLPLRRKLFMSPHIISEGNFVINENHNSFKKLERLIILRNRILHNKEFLKEFEIPDLNLEVSKDGIIVPEEKTEINFEFEIKDNPIDTLNQKICIEFGNSLGDFKKYIMTPSINGELMENPMILKHK